MLLELISTQTHSLSPSDITELILDDWRIAEFSASDSAVIESFPGLKCLSLNGCGLKCLAGFPRLSQLLKLDLNDNKISDSLAPLATLTSLVSLSLANNPLKTIPILHPLVRTNQSLLPRLACLDLFNCPVTFMEGYRSAVFDMIEGLEVLDGRDFGGESISDEEEDEREQLELERIIDGQAECELLEESDESIESDSSSEVGSPTKRQKI